MCQIPLTSIAMELYCQKNESIDHNFAGGFQEGATADYGNAASSIQKDLDMKIHHAFSGQVYVAADGIGMKNFFQFLMFIEDFIPRDLLVLVCSYIAVCMST